LLVLYLAQRVAYGRSRLAAAANLLLALGTSLVVLGAAILPAGLEQALTNINDQMAVLPLGLSRILGLTVHLDIPLALPNYLIGLGLALATSGLVMRLLRWVFGSRAATA
jgi:hypothetical protein